MTSCRVACGPLAKQSAAGAGTAGYPQQSVPGPYDRTLKSGREQTSKNPRRLVADGVDMTALPTTGTDGNARLTSVTGMLLLVLLAVEGVTVLRIHQLISLHIYLGVLLLGPVILKTLSTSY